MTSASQVPQSSAPVAQLVADASMAVTHCDAVFIDVFGSDVTGRNFAGLVSAKDRRGLRSLTTATTSYGGGVVDLTLALDLDGERFCRVRARRDGDAWRIYVEDLLQHQDDAFLALTQSAERWAVLIGQSDDGIAILDANHEIVQFNSRFVALGAFASSHGVLLNEESLPGRDLFKVAPDETAFVEMRNVVEQSRTKKRKRFRGVTDRLDRCVEMTTSAIHMPVRGFIGTCVIFKDVTAQKMLEIASRDLKAKNDDIQAMLQNLHQGVFTMVEGDVVHHEYSNHLEDILGTRDIAGRAVVPLLFDMAKISGDERSSVEATIRTTLGLHTVLFEMNASQLPSEFERTAPDGTVRLLQAEWVPLSDQSGDIEKLLVTLRDVTELRALEVEQRRQNEQLAVIAELVKIEANEFMAFEANARALLDEIRSELVPTRPDAEAVARLFRHYHTIKGNSRFKGLRAMSAAAHDAESALAVLRDEPGSEWSPEALRADLAVVQRTLRDYRHVNDDVLGRSTGRSTPAGHVVLSSDEINQLASQIQDAASDPVRLARVLDRLRSRAATGVAELFAPVARGLGGVAEAVGKPVPHVVVEDPAEVALDFRIVDAMRDVLVHVATNAVDHGLDTPAARQARGLGARGELTLRTNPCADRGVDFVFFDDGPGFDLDRMRARTGEQEATDEEVVEFMFRAGVTTSEAVTVTSGRGVGMDAARRLAESFGGRLWIEFADSETRTMQSGRRTIRIHIHVPGDRICVAKSAGIAA